MNGFVDCLCCVGSPPPWPAAYIGKIKQEANVKLYNMVVYERHYSNAGMRILNYLPIFNC